MAVAVTCPCCDRKILVAEKFAGRRVLCPRCDRPVRVPRHYQDLDDDPAGGMPEPVELEPAPLPHSTHFGLAAVTLATVSVMILCLPVIGYISFALSGLGLLLGLVGLVTYNSPDKDPAGRSRRGRTFLGMDLYARSFPWVGILACLVAIALAWWPIWDKVL